MFWYDDDVYRALKCAFLVITIIIICYVFCIAFGRCCDELILTPIFFFSTYFHHNFIKIDMRALISFNLLSMLLLLSLKICSYKNNCRNVAHVRTSHIFTLLFYFMQLQITNNIINFFFFCSCSCSCTSNFIRKSFLFCTKRRVKINIVQTFILGFIYEKYYHEKVFSVHVIVLDIK